jgi:hypothetical protein
MKRPVFAALILWLALLPVAARAEEGTDKPEPADITNSCAPWDGAATSILLKDSHVRASVYARLSPEAPQGKETTYTAAPDQPNRGGAEIMVCDDHDANCDVRAGTISLTPEGGDLYLGHLDWSDGKNIVHLPFRGKYQFKQMFCG